MAPAAAALPQVTVETPAPRVPRYLRLWFLCWPSPPTARLASCSWGSTPRRASPTPSGIPPTLPSGPALGAWPRTTCSRPHYAFALPVALSGCRCLMATALSLPACLCHCRCCHGCLPRRFPAHGLAKAERQLGGGGEEKIAAAAATGAATTPVVVAAATAAARRRRRRWRRDDLVFVNTINLTETCLPLRVRVAQPYARDFAAPPGLLHDSDSRARIPLSRRQLLF